MTVDLERIGEHLSGDELEAQVNQMLDELWALEPALRGKAVGQIIARLDEVTAEPVRRAIMRQRGRGCFSTWVLDSAREHLENAADLDDLLARLNLANIGGGRLEKDSDTITGSYASCPCPLVNAAQVPISATYCECSCGWYQELFETFLGRPVQVELVDSIAHGAESCSFVIRM
jgi:predicted hydrocarbon binding protein